MRVMNQTDVAVVGAGPIGIELGVALKRAGIDYIHFEAKQVGHTISWFPRQARFFSSNERIAIAGVPLVTDDQNKASREQYLAYLRAVIEQFDLKINTREPVIGIEPADDGFTLTSQPAGGAQRQTRVKRIMLATGDMDHPRRLNIPGEDLPHVSHYFDEPHTYFHTRLLIVGGKNSAAEAALRCHHAGARVAISYRRDRLPEKSVKYWILPEINHLIATERIIAYFQTTPTRITPTHVTLSRGNESFDIPADHVLLLTGYVQDPGLFQIAGIALGGANNAPVFDEQTMQTSIPGIYVAGTATGGTQQRYTVFIENCHVHVERIVRALQGVEPPPAPVTLEEPET